MLGHGLAKLGRIDLQKMVKSWVNPFFLQVKKF